VFERTEHIMGEHTCSDMPSMAVTFSGPREHHDVVVNGWQVPFLEAHMQGEDRVLLVIDQRLGAEFSVAEAEQVIPFVADAISVALGFGAHPGASVETLPVRLPPFRPRRMTGLVSASADSGFDEPMA
jgi:hypothetical protein